MCVCGKVVSGRAYVCVYALAHNVFPPPRPAGSCVDSGWLKCRSERRQPPNQHFSSPLSCPLQTPPPPSLSSPQLLQSSPLPMASLLQLMPLLLAISPNLQSSCQCLCQDLKSMQKANSCKTCALIVDTQYLFAKSLCAHFFAMLRHFYGMNR